MRQDQDLCFSLKYENVAWYEDGAFKLLNRRIYPVRTEFIRCTSYKEVAKAIAARFCEFHTSVAAAVCGMALAAYEFRGQKPDQKKESLKKVAEVFTECRPALSANIGKFMQPTLKVAYDAIDKNEEVDAAIMAFYLKSIEAVYSVQAKIGKHMADLCPDYGNIMINAPESIYPAMLVRELNKSGKEINIFVPEQRPTCSGSRMVAAAISEMKGEATIISDASVAFVMKRKRIKAYFNCAGTIYEDGYGVSLIGGFQSSLSAKYWGIPNYLVAIPARGTIKSSLMALEEYKPAEVLTVLGHQIAFRGALGYAPSHDVTPPDVCDGIITDKGLFTVDTLYEYFGDPAPEKSESKEKEQKPDKGKEDSKDDSKVASKEDSKDDSKAAPKEEKSEASQTEDGEKDKAKVEQKISEAKTEEKQEEKDDSDELSPEDIKIPDFSPEKLGKLEFSQIASDGIRQSKQSLGLLDQGSANIKIDMDNKKSLNQKDDSSDSTKDPAATKDEFHSGIKAMDELSDSSKNIPKTLSSSGSSAFPFPQEEENEADDDSLFGEDDGALPDFVKSTFSSSVYSGPKSNPDQMDFLSQFDESAFDDDSSSLFVSPGSNFTPEQKEAPSTQSQVQPKKEKEDKRENDKSKPPVMVLSDGTQIRSFDDLDTDVQAELRKLNTPLEKLDVKMVERMQKEAWKKRANSAINKASDKALANVKKPNVKVNVSQVSSDYVPSADEFAKAREELEKMAGEIMATTKPSETIPRRKMDQEKKALVIETPDDTAAKRQTKKREVMADLGLSTPTVSTPSPAPSSPQANQAWKPVQGTEAADKAENKRGIFGNLFSRKNEAIVETPFAEIDLTPYDPAANQDSSNPQDVSINEAMDTEGDDIPAWQISMLQKASDD